MNFDEKMKKITKKINLRTILALLKFIPFVLKRKI